MAKFLLAFSLCIALACSSSINSGAFVKPPTEILNGNGVSNYQYKHDVQLTHFNDEKTLALVGFTSDSTGSPLTGYVKTIDTATLQVIGKETVFTAGSRACVKNIYSKDRSNYLVSTPNGRFAYACAIAGQTPTTYRLSVRSFTAQGEEDSFTFASIAENQDAAIEKQWYQDGFFYVLYVVRQGEKDQWTAMLQGFNADNLKEVKFAAGAVKVDQFDNYKLFYSGAIDCDKALENVAVCSWRELKQKKVVSVEINLSKGLVGNQVLVAEDTKDTSYEYKQVLHLKDSYAIVCIKKILKNYTFSTPSGVRTSTALMSTGLALKLSASSSLIVDLPLKQYMDIAELHRAFLYNDYLYVVVKSKEYHDSPTEFDENLDNQFDLLKYDLKGNLQASPIKLFQDFAALEDVITIPNHFPLLVFTDSMDQAYGSVFLGELNLKNLAAMNFLALY